MSNFLTAEFFLIQLPGFLALILVILSFQKNSRNRTLTLLLLASFLFMIHFILLNSFTGAMMNALSGFRAFVFYFRDKHRITGNRMVMYIFIFLFWIGGIVSYGSLHDALPVIAATLECFALWSLNTRYMRYLFLSARPFWLVYNIISLSWAGMITEILLILSLLSAIYRYDIKATGISKESI